MKNLILIFFCSIAATSLSHALVTCEGPADSSAHYIIIKAINSKNVVLFQERISSDILNTEQTLQLCEKQLNQYSYLSQSGGSVFEPFAIIGGGFQLVYDREQSKWINPRNGNIITDRSPTFVIRPTWDDCEQYVASSAANKLKKQLSESN